MSAAGTSTAPRNLDVSSSSRVPLSRLIGVELRKMLDTRGGFWLLALTLLFVALTVSIVLLVVGLNTDMGAPGIMDWVQILSLPLSVLLPVFPILSVTSEWGQRTALVTFSLEPNRLKVLAAKLGAVVLLAIGTMVFAAVLGVVAAPIGASLAGIDMVWEVDGAVLAGTLMAQLLYFFMAFALGTALLSTPGSISAFYVMALMVPMMVYSTLSVLFEWAANLIPWIDIQFASTPFISSGQDLVGQDWARLLVASAIWIVAPLAIGISRIVRSEVK